jgi:NAD(P)-dependent dehydrogenase (short-subunit alcohol dehydrogenase family)
MAFWLMRFVQAGPSQTALNVWHSLKRIKLDKTTDAIIGEWARSIALNRMAQPEEIAKLVVFLASEKASYMTGAVVQVDGGVIKSLL